MSNTTQDVIEVVQKRYLFKILSPRMKLVSNIRECPKTLIFQSQDLGKLFKSKQDFIKVDKSHICVYMALNMYFNQNFESQAKNLQISGTTVTKNKNHNKT